MIGKVITGYFQSLQNLFNPMQIYFDTFYVSTIEDLKQAMTSYNLRQMFDFDKLAAANITQDLLDALRSPRPGGGSYNCIQYKYSSLRKHSQHPNSDIYYVTYDKEQNAFQMANINTPRKAVEIDPQLLKALQAEFIEQEKNDPNTPMQQTINESQGYDIIPAVEIKPTRSSRLAFYGEISLDCRFITTNTSLFEDFQILYNALLHKRNPPAFIQFKSMPDGDWPITTRHAEITSATQIDPSRYGNLSEVSFSVTLETMFMSSYVKDDVPINSVRLFYETKE